MEITDGHALLSPPPPSHSHSHSPFDSKDHVKELEFYKNLAAKAASLANQHSPPPMPLPLPLPMQIDGEEDENEGDGEGEGEAEEQSAEVMRLRREEQAQAKAFAAHLNGTSEYISKAKQQHTQRTHCQGWKRLPFPI